MRNPERLKDFLTVLMGFDGKVLTNEIIESVAKALIKKGLYKPTRVLPTVKKQMGK